MYSSLMADVPSEGTSLFNSAAGRLPPPSKVETEECEGGVCEFKRPQRKTTEPVSQPAPTLPPRPSKGGYSIIVHQIWIQGEAALPDKFKPVVAAYRRLNSEYILWDHFLIRELIQRHYPYLLEVYDNYEFWVMKVDLGKYVILCHYGGFYVDMDTQPYKSFASLALLSEGLPLMEVVDDDWRVKMYFRNFVNNHFFYIPYPDDPFMHYLLSCVPHTAQRPFFRFMIEHILGSIGPMFVMDCIERYIEGGGKVTLYSSSVIRPYFTHEGHVSWLSKRWFDGQDKITIFMLACMVVLVFMSVKRHPGVA